MVMMLGYNFGIVEFVVLLFVCLLMDFDFCCYFIVVMLVVDFQIDDWFDVQVGQGSVLDFVWIDGCD